VLGAGSKGTVKKKMMTNCCRVIVSAALAVSLVQVGILTTPVAAQELSLFDRPWTGSVIREAGGPPIPIYEGWYPNEDGTHSLCFGYYSMNTGEDVTIPLGPNNFVEPSRYDGLQPDYFERIPERPFTYRRRYCAFAVEVPSDFSAEDRVTWTLLDPRDGRNEPLSAIGHLGRYHRLDELESPGRGDYAPALRFEEEGAGQRGRGGFVHGPLTARVGEPLTLDLWVEYPVRDRVWVGWAKHQGPANVDFSTVSEYIDTHSGVGIATTDVVFGQSGEYLIRVQSIDNPVADFEFHCCWTNGFVRVVVE